MPVSGVAGYYTALRRSGGGVIIAWRRCAGAGKPRHDGRGRKRLCMLHEGKSWVAPPEPVLGSAYGRARGRAMTEESEPFRRLL